MHNKIIKIIKVDWNSVKLKAWDFFFLFLQKKMCVCFVACLEAIFLFSTNENGE